MTFDQKVLFEKLVNSLPKLHIKLKEQLHSLVKVHSIVPTSEVDNDVSNIFKMNDIHKETPILIPWRGKYLLINYEPYTPWDNASQKSLGLLLITQIIKNVLLEWENDHLEMMIYQDDLTNVYNYRRLCEDLESQLKQDRVFTLAFFDIDDLKKINEVHGHFVGSRIIKHMAKRLSSELGKSYQLYRYGGDEFVCLFDQLESKQVQLALENVMKFLQRDPFITDQGQVIPMGISVGLAEFPKDGNSMKEIIELADKMMYSAKKIGKFKVIQPTTNKKVA